MIAGVLSNLTTLEVLDISGNKLTDKVILMGRMGQFPNLTVLSMAGNKFENLPIDQLVTYKNLKELHVENNELTKYYPELTEQVKVGLDVYYKGIADIIGQILNFKKYT